MLYCKLQFTDNDGEAGISIESVLNETENLDYFERTEDGYELESESICFVEEAELLAQHLVPCVPETGFVMKGSVEDHGLEMLFEILYESGKLTKRVTGWGGYSDSDDIDSLLSEPFELSVEAPGICPVCGEQMDHGTPLIRAKDGTVYHIWCAEEAGIEGEMV